MLHHSCQRNRQNGDYRSHYQPTVRILEDSKRGVFPGKRKSNPRGFLHGCEIHLPEARGHNVRPEHSEQNRDNLYHPPPPDIAYHYYGYGQNRYPPILTAILDCRSGKGQTDSYDDRACNYRREETHHFLGTESRKKTGQHEIHEPCAENSDTRIGKRLRKCHSLGHTHLSDSRIAAEKSKG